MCIWYTCNIDRATSRIYCIAGSHSFAHKRMHTHLWYARPHMPTYTRWFCAASTRCNSVKDTNNALIFGTKALGPQEFILYTLSTHRIVRRRDAYNISLLYEHVLMSGKGTRSRFRWLAEASFWRGSHACFATCIHEFMYTQNLYHVLLIYETEKLICSQHVYWTIQTSTVISPGPEIRDATE